MRPTGSKSREATATIARIVARQYGVIARRQALEAGVEPSLFDGRIADGRLSPVLRGVYSQGAGPLSQHARWQAAVLAAGPSAALSGKSAAALHGLTRPESGPIEVVRIRASTRYRSIPGADGTSFQVNVLRSRHLPESDLVEVDGILATSVARTYLAVASGFSDSRLMSAFARGEQLRIVDWSQVHEVSMRGKGWTGSAKLRRVLEGWNPLEVEAASELERIFVRLCQTSGIKLPRINALVNGYLVDFLWEDEKLIIEVDGYEFHGGRRSFRSDRNRDVEHALAGFRVARFTYHDLVEDPQGSARRIRGLIQMGFN